MIEEYFGYIGYEPQLEAAYSHMRKGRSVIFTGPAGCGKTSLVKMSAKIMGDRRAQSFPMFIDYCNPMKQFVITLIVKLHHRNLLDNEYMRLDEETLKKRLSREHYRHSVKIALDAIRRHPGLFIGIDDIDLLTPVGRSIVLELTSSDTGAIVCGAATRRTAAVKRVMYQFQAVEVPPMNESVVRKITEKFISQRGGLVEDKKHFIETMTWKAAGNILALDNMLRYFKNEPHIRTDEVRKISQGASRREVSMEWMIYAVFAFVVMLRFVSRATMNKQLYIITSVIAALFIVFRYLLAKGNRSD